MCLILVVLELIGQLILTGGRVSLIEHHLSKGSTIGSDVPLCDDECLGLI